MKIKNLFILLIIIIISLTISCSNQEVIENPNNTIEPNDGEIDPNSKISRSEFMLNTYIKITLYGTDNNELFEEIYKDIEELEGNLSVHIVNSDLYKLKENAGKSYTEVSDDTVEIMQKSIEYSKFSDGLFDVTAGPLIELWSIGTSNEKIPNEEEITKTLELIDYNDILINVNENKIMFKKEKMFADFGAIAKGYIADKTADKIKELGVNNAIVDLGGNVLLIGSKPNGSNFRIGIQNPDEARGGYLGILSVSDLSIVTSGDYERYFIQDGIKYHHILDPYTGFPSKNNLKSVSIITKKSFDGDALSTTILLMGLEKGLEKINQLNDVEAIFVTKDNKIYITNGIKDKFELTDNNYSIVN